MVSAAKYLCILFLFLFLTGCGARGLYNWCNYDTKLYKHYKNPAERDEFVQALKETMDAAEQEGKVPPGIYAEYGFVLYEEGSNQQAIVYFQKEADKWPESRAFMTKLIAMANNRAANQKANRERPLAPEINADKNMPKPLSEVSP